PSVGSPSTASSGKTASTDWPNTWRKNHERSHTHREGRSTARSDLGGVTVATKDPARGKRPVDTRALVITRLFDAPRERLWQAWTDPEHVKRWWGPKGFTTPLCTIDLRVGGELLYCMRSPEGKDYWSKNVYREIVVERVFDAPRSRVFEAYTDPKLIPLWWGPRRYTITVDKMDVRPGGVWRYISRGADGAEDTFNGVYREVARPVRLVSTFEYEGMPGHIMVDTA